MATQGHTAIPCRAGTTVRLPSFQPRVLGGSAQCQGNRKGLSGSALFSSLHPSSLKAQAQFFRGCQAHK